jgi:C1A family cysteine protease
MFSNVTKLPKTDNSFLIISECLALYGLPTTPILNEAYSIETYHTDSKESGHTVVVVDWNDHTLTLFWTNEH